MNRLATGTGRGVVTLACALASLLSACSPLGRRADDPVAAARRRQIAELEVAANPASPQTLLVSAAASADPTVRHAVALNPATPPEVLTRLASDVNWAVRLAVVGNPGTPEQVVAALGSEVLPRSDWTYWSDDNWRRRHQEELIARPFEPGLAFTEINLAISRPFRLRAAIVNQAGRRNDVVVSFSYALRFKYYNQTLNYMMYDSVEVSVYRRTPGGYRLDGRRRFENLPADSLPGGLDKQRFLLDIVQVAADAKALAGSSGQLAE